jgi:hypothetical protein
VVTGVADAVRPYLVAKDFAGIRYYDYSIAQPENPFVRWVSSHWTAGQQAAFADTIQPYLVSSDLTMIRNCG